jgi:hypothetical protein
MTTYHSSSMVHWWVLVHCGPDLQVMYAARLTIVDLFLHCTGQNSFEVGECRVVSCSILLQYPSSKKSSGLGKNQKLDAHSCCESFQALSQDLQPACLQLWPRVSRLCRNGTKYNSFSSSFSGPPVYRVSVCQSFCLCLSCY